MVTTLLNINKNGQRGVPSANPLQQIRVSSFITRYPYFLVINRNFLCLCKLGIIEGRIEAVLGEKLGMVALLDDVAVLHYEDKVGITDC